MTDDWQVVEEALGESRITPDDWKLVLEAFARLREREAQRPSKEDVEKRVAWWINDFHFKAPEQLTDGYWRMMATEIAEYALAHEEETP